jgi:hypothetical protein
VILGGPRLGERGLERLDGLGQRRDVLADGRQDVARDVERPAFLLDLVQRDDLGAVLDVLEGAVPGDDLLAVLGIEEVLGAAFPEQARGVDDEHLVLARLGLLAAQDDDAAGELGAVEEVRREADDRLDQSSLSSAVRILPSAAFRNSAPCGSTTAMRLFPVGAIDAIMCCTKA